MPHKQQQLINLFPLHPENIVQDHKDNVHEQHDDQVSDHVAFLFETAADDTSTSLHGILDSTTTTTTTCTTTTTTTTSDEGSPLSPSLTYVYRGHESHHEHQGSLVKTAMKCKERDASEERWVSYWEVVEKKEQEVGELLGITQSPLTSSPVDNKYSLTLSTNSLPSISSIAISMS